MQDTELAAVNEAVADCARTLNIILPSGSATDQLA